MKGKQCSKCGEVKKVSDFHRRGKNDDSPRPECKECGKKQGRKNRAGSILKYRKRERIYKAAHPNVISEEKKAERRELQRAYYERNSNRQGAKKSVCAAVDRGKRYLAGTIGTRAAQGSMLFKPCTCRMCGHPHAPSDIHGHHYLGYAPQNWLDVIWMCTECHSRIGVSDRECSAMGEPRHVAFQRFHKHAEEAISGGKA